MFRARLVRIAVVVAAIVSGWAVAPAAQQQPTPNVLEGHIVDDKGNPIEGAEVYATFQSNPGQHVTKQISAKSGPNGYYAIRFDSGQPVGTWSASAQANYGDWRLSLIASSEEPFAGNAGAIRDFTLRLVEEAPGKPYGIGGKVIIDRAFNQFFKFNDVKLTLEHTETKKTITKNLRELNSSGYVTGLEPGPYKISATLNGAQVLLSPDMADKNFQSSYKGDFTPVMSDIYEIHLYAKAASDGSTPPGEPTPVPFPDTDDGFIRTNAAPKDLGKWQVRSTRVYYRPVDDGTMPNVIVAFYARNNALIPQTFSSSFRLELNGAATYAPTDMQYLTNSPGSGGNPVATAMISSIVPLNPNRTVKIGEEVAVYASFRIDPAARSGVKSVKITAIGRASPILKTSEASTTVELPAAPGASTPAPTPTPTPAPTPTPTPSPTPTPMPTPDTSGNPIAIQGSVYNLGRWSVRVSEVHYKTPTSMTVSITAKNKTLASLPPASVFDFALQSRSKTSVKAIAYGSTSPVKPLGEVVVTAAFDLSRAEQEAVQSILITELAQPKISLLLIKAQAATSVSIPVQPRARASTPPSTEKTGAPPPEVKTSIPTPTPTPTPTPKPAEATTTNVGGGFRNTGYLFTRLDAVRRGADGAVEVTFTMRNDQNVRRSIWNNDNTWTLIGSDGLSYKYDGNDYGRDGSEPRKTSTWLEKGDSNVITYVYRKVPAGVKPGRLVVRDYYGKVITEYDLGAGAGAP